MNTLPHLLHQREHILLEARISAFPAMRGVYLLLAYAGAVGALMGVMIAQTPGLSLQHFSYYCSFTEGCARLCDHIARANPALRIPADTLKLLSSWPLVAATLTAFAATILRGILLKMKTELMVTNMRVMAKFGWLARNVEELHHASVQDLSLTQSVLGRIFNYGTIHIRGYAGVLARVDFVRDPFYFRMEALEEMERCLQEQSPS